MSQFCMSCMEQYDDNLTVCPHCGSDRTVGDDALHIPQGTVLRERYIVGKCLGFGGFGVTYIGYDALLEHKVAIKEYLPSEFSTRAIGDTAVTIIGGEADQRAEQFHDGLVKFHEEAKRLAKFSSVDGIVKIFDTFEENNTAYIIMELLEGETLSARLERDGKIPHEEAVGLILPIAESLASVHETGIIHRDIAPDNVFLTKDGKAKLIDFGAARYASSTHSKSLTMLIKPGFSPVEQYQSKDPQGSFTDVYALSAVLYRMITGIDPPDALNRLTSLRNKRTDLLQPASKHCKDIPDDLENAILNALNLRAEDRTATMNDFIAELKSETRVRRRKGRIKGVDFFTWPLWAKILVPTAAVLILTLGTLFAAGIIGFRNDIQEHIFIPDGMSRVPSVVNTGMADAELRLTDALLLYSIAGKEYSDKIPADMILTQSIGGGAVVAENTLIDLVVSGGAQMAVIPNVEGLYSEDAIQSLKALGFAVSMEYAYSNAMAESAVLSQSIDGNTEMPVGTEIVLTISLGRDPNEAFEAVEITVPEFIGKTYEEAQQIAQEAGLMLLAKTRTYSAEYPENTIMAQSAAPGTPIMSGSTIELTVSLGIQIIRVPDVQYRTEADAIALLEANGLTANISYETSDTVRAGLVMTQNPPAGAETDPGTAISLVVSKGGKPFAMPSVVGMTEAEARAALSAKGLTVSVGYEHSSTAAEGTVLAQSIGANTEVYAGSAVILTISTGEELFSVPAVVGMKRADAESALRSAGFTVKVNEIFSDTVPAGQVITQNPAGGTSQPKGTSILLEVSKGSNIILPASVSLNTKTASLNYGDSIQLAATVSPSTATNKQVNWSSDNPDVATVTITGFVVAKGPGTATITAETAAGGKKATCIVMVSTPEVTLEYDNLDLCTGESYTLGCTMKPTQLKWTSSNPNVASVSSSGVVTCLNAGDVNITASLTFGGITYKDVCRIRVVSPEVTLTAPELLGKGETARVTAATNTPNMIVMSWESSDPSVLSVDNSGNLSAVSEGTATITAHATYYGLATTRDYSASIVIRVVENVQLTMVQSSLNGHVGDQLLVMVLADADNPTVNWSCSNPAVIKLGAPTSSTGFAYAYVTGISPGTAVVTASTSTSSVSCTITIAEKGDVHVQIGTSYLDAAAAGQRVTVPVYLSNNAGVSSYEFGIRMAAVNDHAIDPYGGDIKIPVADYKNGDLIWLSGATTRTVTDTGTLFTVVLTIPANAKPGDVYRIEYVSQATDSHLWYDFNSQTDYVAGGRVTYTSGYFIVH